MLPLDSPRWAALRHVFGPARDVPSHLESLARDPRQPPDSPTWTWFFTALYHQGTVCEATFAAVPHVVEIAARLAPAERGWYASVVGGVAGASDCEQRVSADIVQWYAAAIERARPTITEYIETCPRNRTEMLYALGALASLHGARRAASVFEGIASGEWELECPACHDWLWVGPPDRPEVVDSQANALPTHPDAAGGAARAQYLPAIPPPWWSEREALANLGGLARRAGRGEITVLLAGLPRELRCQRCGQPFDLEAALLRA